MKDNITLMKDNIVFIADKLYKNSIDLYLILAYDEDKMSYSVYKRLHKISDDLSILIGDLHRLIYYAEKEQT